LTALKRLVKSSVTATAKAARPSLTAANAATPEPA
jgi:hypothetical protein